jgi:hydrogenase maturation protein HypF
VALAVHDQVFVSQHVGDLETPQAENAFREVIDHLEDVYEAPPAELAADLHPDYVATRYALARGRPVRRVQHHLAHVLACLAENGHDGPALGVAWDGVGLGLDGTVWGGEFLLVNGDGWQRVASLRPFPLPGGDAVAREPRRAALGLLHEMDGAVALERTELAPIAAFTPGERTLLGRMLAGGTGCFTSTSAGRLFDAAAALTGLRQRATFEGQAAMELEWSLDPAADGRYPLPLRGAIPAAGERPSPAGDAPARLDWQPLFTELLADVAAGRPVGAISARFHRALVRGIVTVADEVRRVSGTTTVALSGGCFQNRFLLEETVAALTEAGGAPLWHRQVPPNDGGVALGQVVAVRRGLAGALPTSPSSLTPPA